MLTSLTRASLALAAVLALLGCHQQVRPAPLVAPSRLCPKPMPALSEAEMKAAFLKGRDHGFLFKVTKGSTTSWLYGTLHVNKPEWMMPGPQMLGAWSRSDVLAMELSPEDLKKVVPAATGDKSNEGAPLGGPTLEAAQALCLQPAQLAQFARLPRTVQLAGLLLVDAGRVGLWPQYGSDLFLAGMANGSKKPIVSLETIEGQQRAMAGLMPDDERGVQRFADYIVQQKNLPVFEALGQAWVDGNLDGLSPALLCPTCAGDPKQARSLEAGMVARNHVQAERVVQLHEQGTRLFVAVGSMHLAGPEGLPRLLEQRGFTVERVHFTDATADSVLPAYGH